MRFIISMMLALVVSGAVSVEAQSGVPLELDLPPDFKVTEEHWVDDSRPAAGWYLQIRMLRGKELRAVGGVSPIHEMQADLPQYDGDPLRKDDLIIGVNGKPLLQHAVDQFAQEVIRARKRKQPLSVTRWRRGTIKAVTLTLQSPDDNIPDLTKGGRPDNTRDWALGPLGVNAWGYARNTMNGGSGKARQLLVTLVDASGPAANKLAIGDVIVGVGNEPFARDARRALATAINEAEKESSKGRLDLLVWRSGETNSVSIRLPVLGEYSETAPFNCSKTDRIVDNAVAYMMQHQQALLKPDDPGWLHYINGLGLMATGREDVMPLVRKMAHASLLAPGETLSVEKHVPMQCWRWSYKTLFLCEYYLLTKDESVLPTIEEYATKIAMGQSGAGTWGHTYAARENTGHLHGHLGGYGAINQQGLTLMVALPLAVTCGVDNQEVRDAIKRGNDFFSFFIGKGTIPYGDHGAKNDWYDDNGKSGSAAVLFDLLDNADGTRFFSEMVLGAAPSGREAGHTGHFWSHLWGGIGAARGGDKGLQVFMQEMEPIFTLERQYDGRFVFQGNVGEKGEQGKPKEIWDSTGSRLLQLCVPRRILYITGKDTPPDTYLTDERIDDILKAGRLDVDQDARATITQEEILALLSDPLPPSRSVAVRILEERELNIVDTLIDMLDSENRFARYGAAEALGRVGFASKPAADTLIRLMESDADTLFRIYAISALTGANPRLGLVRVAKPAIPVLLQMAIKQAPDDPRKVLQHDIGRALFHNEHDQRRSGLLNRYGLDDVDRSLLIPAIKEILTNKNGWARSTLSNFVYPKLTLDECNQLWEDIYLALK